MQLFLNLSKYISLTCNGIVCEPLWLESCFFSFNCRKQVIYGYKQQTTALLMNYLWCKSLLLHSCFFAILRMGDGATSWSSVLSVGIKLPKHYFSWNGSWWLLPFKMPHHSSRSPRKSRQWLCRHQLPNSHSIIPNCHCGSSWRYSFRFSLQSVFSAAALDWSYKLFCSFTQDKHGCLIVRSEKGCCNQIFFTKCCFN